MGEFRTLSGYDRPGALTPAMEDYLEMICRHCREADYIRISRLAELLHVSPSSSTKMAEQLKAQKLIEYEKYGYLRPTEAGRATGDYLLYRHDVIHRFLCTVNGTADELEQTERIEHFLERRTVENLARWMERNGG